jgi:hypothetical protein|nr:MAG TPA: hypothetical protein [Caudoviricetes sp.]
MKIRAILETETMDPDFKEPFLNGMPFDITESTFDRIVRYASGCTDVQQPDVIAMVIQHALDNRKKLSELLDKFNATTQMRVLIPVPLSTITFTKQYQDTLNKVLKERIKETLDGLPQEQRAELLNEVLNETLIEGSLNDD